MRMNALVSSRAALPPSIRGVQERLICLPLAQRDLQHLADLLDHQAQAGSLLAFSLVGRYVMSATHSRSQPLATVLAEQCITPDLD